MKGLQNILSINISISALVIIFFTVLLQFSYPIPLVLGGVAMVNFSLAGVFLFGQDRKMGYAFLLGALVPLTLALGIYGYMYFFAPEKLDFMKDLSNPNQ